tara:strand:+ start:808 stop:1104 length:297 start_codon:yes stop_codon:yes gene_type:complete
MILRSGFSYSYIESKPKIRKKKAKSKEEEKEKEKEEEELCCICYCPYKKSPRKYTKMSCSIKNYNLKYHHYHFGCLVKYVTETGVRNCPYCRSPLFAT